MSAEIVAKLNELLGAERAGVQTLATLKKAHAVSDGDEGGSPEERGLV